MTNSSGPRKDPTHLKLKSRFVKCHHPIESNVESWGFLLTVVRHSAAAMMPDSAFLETQVSFRRFQYYRVLVLCQYNPNFLKSIGDTFPKNLLKWLTKSLFLSLLHLVLLLWVNIFMSDILYRAVVPKITVNCGNQKKKPWKLTYHHQQHVAAAPDLSANTVVLFVQTQLISLTLSWHHDWWDASSSKKKREKLDRWIGIFTYCKN